MSSNLYYSSRVYFSPSGTQFQQPAYATLDVRGQWNPTKNYYVAVYGDNIANSRYRNQVQYNGFGIGRRVERAGGLGCRVRREILKNAAGESPRTGFIRLTACASSHSAHTTSASVVIITKVMISSVYDHTTSIRGQLA